MDKDRPEWLVIRELSTSMQPRLVLQVHVWYDIKIHIHAMTEIASIVTYVHRLIRFTYIQKHGIQQPFSHYFNITIHTVTIQPCCPCTAINCIAVLISEENLCDFQLLK